jgi:GNAT superfamily N-acetyltransferase
MPSPEILSFSNQSRNDKKLLKAFVDFHWTHYQDDPQYVPLLDYEYLGFRLIGMKGFFEPDNLFFKHADMRFFLALADGEVVGRCNAFVNHNHNAYWKEKTGFFGQFESVEDQDIAGQLLDAAAEWLREQGMNRMRGPQNLPVNEATPGLMTAGYNSRPVMYYHYNKPYYKEMLEQADFSAIKRVLSWEVEVMRPMEERLVRVNRKVMERYRISVEPWGKRPLKERKREMFDIYNDAWSDNFGFVPFTEEEFFAIIDDMMLVMDKDLFLFVYVNDEPAAFFGGVPNVTERMSPSSNCRRCELLRAGKMLLTKWKVKGFRLGYLGVKKIFRKMGLAGVMLWQQKQYAQKKGYEYCDMGWILEDNHLVISLVDLISATPSKTYTIYEKSI